MSNNKSNKKDFFKQNNKRWRFLQPATYNLKPSAGFTLVELMVSLSIFVVVIMAAISSLYTVNKAARKVEAMRGVLDNLNFAVESMSRTIRTGTAIGCGSSAGVDCSFASSFNSPGTQLSVQSTLTGNIPVRYQIATNASGNGEIQKSLFSGGVWSTPVSLTDPNINVQHLWFYVDGSSTADTRQPSVVMLIQGVATAGQSTAPFAIQTLVSQRTVE